MDFFVETPIQQVKKVQEKKEKSDFDLLNMWIQLNIHCFYGLAKLTVDA